MSVLNRFELTPYRLRLGLDVLTGLVTVSIAFALAGLIWRIAGHAGTGAITVPSRPPAVAVPDLAPALALAPFGRATANPDAAPPTGLQVELKGLVFASPPSLATAFIATGSEPARAFRIGEQVAGATIETIQPRRVLLRNQGRLESLAFRDPFATPTPAPGAPAAPGQPAPVAQGAAAPVTAPPPVAAPANVGTLMQRFDARPVSGGYQVGANAPAGLQSGDVVQQINGAQLSSPDAAQSAFQRAQQAGNAQIQILRDGRRVTLTVPIR